MNDDLSEPTLDDLDLDTSGCDALGDCSIQDAIVWAAAHVNDRRVTMKDSPGSLGWALYRWLLQSPVNQGVLWLSLLPKVIPSRAESPSGARYHEDDSVTTAELAAKIVEYGGGPIYESVDYTGLEVSESGAADGSAG